MKLVVLIPSHAYRENAGARIRYGRLAEGLSELAISLSLIEIDAFDPMRSDCDIVIVSKVNDARALVVAAALSRRGIHVGIDLFDDYFSIESDSRLVRLRDWLRQMLRLSDFALCSTPPLAGVLRSYRDDLPVHVINDPGPVIDYGDLRELINSKLAQIRSGDPVRICWFGIGDNPYFPVGISDVAAFSHTLSELSQNGRAIELTVLTNRRALHGEALVDISHLPVPTVVEEWTEQRERQVLRQSAACYLPVNAQPFSTGKSLNRAVTALSYGCQLISAGFPLYSALEPFVYRSAAMFLDDLAIDALRLSAGSLDALEAQLAALASATRECAALAEFLRGIDAKAEQGVPPEAPIYLFHGAATSQAAHDMVKKAGGLSIGMDFTAAHLEFDVIVSSESSGRESLIVADDVLSRLDSERRRESIAAAKIGKRKFWSVGREGPKCQSPAALQMPLPVQLASYQSTLQRATAMVSDAFGPGIAVLSENSALPFIPPTKSRQ